MTAPAARVKDIHVCPATGPSGPHVGGPISPPGSPDVITGSAPQARATDRAECASPAPDFIVTGAAMVIVNKKPAARMLSKTAHGGTIVGGEPTVLIGGPSAGSTLGNSGAGTAACAAAASGRASGSTQQSGQNCSLEAPGRSSTRWRRPAGRSRGC